MQDPRWDTYELDLDKVGPMVLADPECVHAELVRKHLPKADIVISDNLTAVEAANVKQRAPLTSEIAKRVFGFEAKLSIEDGVKEYIDKFSKFLASQGLTPAR